MNIVNKTNKKLTTVGEIKTGNFFKIKNLYYIKFKKVSDKILNESELKCIRDIEKDAVMVIYDSLNNVECCDMDLISRDEICEEVNGYIVLNEIYDGSNENGNKNEGE